MSSLRYIFRKITSFKEGLQLLGSQNDAGASRERVQKVGVFHDMGECGSSNLFGCDKSVICFRCRTRLWNDDKGYETVGWRKTTG